MTTIIPEGEAIRKAVKWVASELEENPGQPLRGLVNKAALTFNLSPLETEFLTRFYLQKAEKGAIKEPGQTKS
jgi:hypothetical protein